MIRKYSLSLFALLWMALLPAQAQRQVNYADKLFSQLNFEAAAAWYSDAWASKKGVDDPAHVLARLGDCYRLLNNSGQAETWYAQAVAVDGVGAETVYQYAQMLKANQKYDAALSAFRRYAGLRPDDASVPAILESLTRLEYLMTVNPEVEVAPVDFNTSGSDFGPCIASGKLFFTSNGMPGAGDREDVWTGANFLRLFETELTGQEPDAKAEAVKSGINGRYHDGPVTADPERGDLYVTRSNYQGRKATSGSESLVRLKLMRLASDGQGGWTGEVLDDFPFNSDDYSVGHAAFSPDGQTIYFASDMDHPDAKGGIDLYRASRQDDTWGNLENLGPAVNSAGDDMFPFMSDEGHLFYASNGRGGLGGLDIYEAIPDEGQNWSVYHTGAPLNTHKDDFGLVLFPGTRRGFFASNRPGGAGDDDIYRFTDRGMLLAGRVVDELSGDPLCNSLVELRLAGSVQGTMLTDCDGLFRFPVKPGLDYGLEACLDGYLCNKSVQVSTVSSRPGDVIRAEVPLKQFAPADLLVRAVDASTGEWIADSRIQFYDGCTGNRPEGRRHTEQGARYPVSAGCDYFLSAMAPGYLPRDTNYITASGFDGGVLEIPLISQVRFNAADLDNGLVFHHIYYNFNESGIRSDADADLERIAEFMMANPTAKVSIESHTDARATAAYNKTLSDRRAASAREWLIGRGIGPERLLATGFGESRPVNGCTDNIRCTEEEHQRNRRTEFRVTDGSISTESLERFQVEVDPCPDCPF